MFNRKGIVKLIASNLLFIMIAVSSFVATDTSYVHAATTVKIAHAAHGEKGTTGCKPGDQTGKEVCVRSWTYSSSSSSGFHWNVVVRCNDPKVAAAIATTAVKACNNPHIGYDKGTVKERQSFYKALEAANWDPSKITKDVETSCSPFACACINAAHKKKYIKTDHSCTTLYKTLKADSRFTCFTSKEACTSDKYLKAGDILITTGRHCAIVVEQRAKVTGTPPRNNTSAASKPVLLKAGSTYALTVNLRVRSGAGTNYKIKDYKSLTGEDKKNAAFQSGDAVLKAGTKVKCISTSGNWIRISSGWICGKEGNSNYVKEVSSQAQASVDKTTTAKKTATKKTATTTTKTTKTAKKATTTKATTAKKTKAVKIKAGYNYRLTCAQYVRKGPGSKYGIKKSSALTADAKKHAAKGSKAILKKGTVVTCLQKKGNWMRIPSGWICCKEGNLKAE